MAVQNIDLWFIEPTSSREIGARLPSKLVDSIIEISRCVVGKVEQPDYSLACVIE
jgi:hypothetical protein